MENIKEKSEIKIGAILSYIIIAINMIIGVIYTPILTSKLGQSEYGLYSLVNSVMSYLTILDCGLGNTIIIFVSKALKNKDYKKENQLYSMFLIIYLIIGAVATAIGIILYINADKLLNSSATIKEINTAKTLLGILAINIGITFPGSVFSNMIVAHEKFIFSKVLNIVSIVLKPLIIIPLLFLGFKSIALVLITTIINILVIIINIVFCKSKLKLHFDLRNWDKALLSTIFGFSIWVALQEIIDKVNWSLDNFLLGKLAGTIQVSIYAVAAQLNNIYISTSTAISGVMLPKISKLSEEKENLQENMTNVLIKTGRVQLFVVGLILSGFIIFGKQFIILWVGNEYIQSYYICCALMIPMIISLTQNVSGGILQAQNKHKFMTIIFAIMAIINVLVSIPLIKKFGGLGAALGTGISLIIGNIIIKNIYYQKIIKLDVIKFFKQISLIMITQVILTVCGLLLTNKVLINNWLNLIIGISIYSVIYAIISYRFLMNGFEKGLIKDYIGKIRRIYER